MFLSPSFENIVAICDVKSCTMRTQPSAADVTPNATRSVADPANKSESVVIVIFNSRMQLHGVVEGNEDGKEVKYALQILMEH